MIKEGYVNVEGGGVFAASLTPVRDDFSCYFEELANHCHDLINRGCRGVVLFGTTGEGSSFSVTERENAIKNLIKLGIDPQRLIIGIACCSIHDVVKLASVAIDQNCLAVLIVPPFFYKNVHDAGVVSFYRKIIQKVDSPNLKILLYHIPQCSGVPITLGVIKKNLRRICGWENSRQIPIESTFSRAMADFAETELPQNVHRELIKKTFKETETIVLHNSRDSTTVEAREKPSKKDSIALSEQGDAQRVKKRGRPKNGEKRPPKEPTRIEKQQAMSLEEMLADLPKRCDIGTKKNSKGHAAHWIGYKLHLDISDGCIPLSAILTSASVHDSQVAIPLAEMTARRIVNLYDLMDSAYDVPGIIAHSKSLGHIPLIDKNPRRDKVLVEELKAEGKRQKLLNLESAEKIRYKERTTAERANSRLKDEFGGCTVKVRGHAKVMCHLMFGVLVLAADQLMKLVT